MEASTRSGRAPALPPAGRKKLSAGLTFFGLGHFLLGRRNGELKSADSRPGRCPRTDRRLGLASLGDVRVVKPLTLPAGVPPRPAPSPVTARSAGSVPVLRGTSPWQLIGFGPRGGRRALWKSAAVDREGLALPLPEKEPLVNRWPPSPPPPLVPTPVHRSRGAGAALHPPRDGAEGRPGSWPTDAVVNGVYRGPPRSVLP